MMVFTLTGTDPALNLALEEHLLETPPPGVGGGPLLLLYENSEAVIIGKNQNPWLEVPPAAPARGSPPLYRRVSGGGAVYHGRGDLNFAFILPQAGFSKEGNLDLVRRALARLGLQAERTGRGDLLVEGRKISGNALCYRKGRVLHHGTLLVDADLRALRESLSAGPPDPGGYHIETRAVASVPMGVANLRDFLPGLSLEETVEALAREASGAARDSGRPPAEVFEPGPESREDLERRRRRHLDPAWVYGHTPLFTCRVGGDVYRVENGVIVEVGGEGVRALKGRSFDTALLEAVVQNDR